MESNYSISAGDLNVLNSRLGLEKKSAAFLLIKRVFDILLSLIGLAILSPIILITSIAIYIEDRGPVFYVQSRVGRNHKIFNIYKFRSMRKGADKIHEQMRVEAGCEEISFKLKTDPRVTKVGNFIRKFNIDELPQLINILKGDMSIVGPRPLPVYEYEEERKTWGDKYSARYTVPQGLTCTWQISNRADVSFERRMEMDCEYAKENSLVKDIELIIKTFLYTVIGKAEY